MTNTNIPLRLFLILAGPMRDAIEKYCASVKACDEATLAITSPLQDVARHFMRGFDGRPIGIMFDKEIPPGWTQPKTKDNLSRPFKSNPLYEQWKAIPPFLNESTLIEEIIGIPLLIPYTTNDGGVGSAVLLPYVLRPCQFVYAGRDAGPYAFAIYDFPTALAHWHEENPGRTVAQPIKDWKLELEGVTEISQAEWDAVVKEAQEKVHV